ncbi:MAG: TonB-dependent receptor [Bacteroidota bacterium]
MKQNILTFAILIFLAVGQVWAQNARLSGVVGDSAEGGLAFAKIQVADTKLGTIADDSGRFVLQNIPPGTYQITAQYLGYESRTQEVTFTGNADLQLDFTLIPSGTAQEDVVITGTLKPSTRLASPVPVEVYRPKFFQKNPTPNIYEALQNVNGVRPQLNCQVCNTGDIHINGLEGPYTMVLIDGMPIVSSLATVYGLSGIPNSLIERVEVVKGPASSLYGSEAIGGLINVITKDPAKAPLFTADVFATSWQEVNADVSLKLNLGPKVSVLTTANYFNFDNVVDNNADNFTDMAIQERISVFQKWSFQRKENRLFTLAGRFYDESRWGGELNWTPEFRGGDLIYGEAIDTRRWEVIGQYQLPTREKMMLSFSFNDHNQNSVYGDVPYVAKQTIGFGQLTWDKKVGRHDLLSGATLRYTYYDDNTPATGGEVQSATNNPSEIWLPGIFVQDEITLSDKHKTLLGLRYDYNTAHGNIFTPRLAHKWTISPNDVLRLNAGTGFRVVNLFTEDHAALTGAREVIIAEELRPERSYNVNLNYTRKWFFNGGAALGLETSAFYTYFTNVILPDYDTNPNQIIYDNLDGSADTKGISANLDLILPNGLSFIAGATLMDVSTVENGERERQILTERFTGTWQISYRFLKDQLRLDYTGNLYGPMLLPLLGDLDPRPESSPWWSIQNLQLTYRGLKNFEIYGGAKNLLNWTPWKNQDEPIIARAFDPFDRGVTFDGDGNVVATPNNPNALTFDPSYVYGPNQGIRGFLGIRCSFLGK